MSAGNKKRKYKCRSMRLLAEVARNSSAPVVQKGVLTMGIASTCMASNRPSSSTTQLRLRSRKLIHITDFEAGGRKQIKSEEFFCGYLPESEIERRLTKEGDFLVRKVIKGDEDTYVLSYMCQSGVLDGVRHRPIHFDEENRVYFMTTHCFDCISSLIAYHCNKNLSVDEFDGKIKTAVKRDSWQLYHAQIENLKKLGNGAFGEVWLCKLQVGLFKEIEVAVKVCIAPEETQAEESEKLFTEAQTMLRLIHPNIVKLVGVAMYEQPIKIALELCPGGSVLDLLENHHKELTEERRRHLILGAARGMAYLEQEMIIHRDIAARNILIGRKGEPKISDFGLSMLGVDYRVKKLQKVPVRYLAPETLKEGHFSSKSDVFAFGVYIWEVYQNGRQPWEDIEDHRKIIKLVRGGSRLENDNDLCPQVFWELAENCWKQEPLQRPSFSEIVAEYGPLDEIDQSKGLWTRIKEFFVRN